MMGFMAYKTREIFNFASDVFGKDTIEEPEPAGYLNTKGEWAA